MPPEPSLQANLQAPFAEQVAFFRQKLGNLVPTAKWDDLWKSHHDRGFMVAGAAKADMLSDFASAVDSAIVEGKSIQWFRKNFDNIVNKHGWSYTGERNWRSRIIYQTNISSSYAAGRLAQLQEGGYPLWMYRHSDISARPRPHHVALDGLIRPANDDFWSTHYPPNGWGCKCRVVGVRSNKQAERLGGNPDKDLPGWVNDIDAKTGEPVGIDKGWGYMPGSTVVDAVRALRPKLDMLPAMPAIELIQDWLKTEAFTEWFENPKELWPLLRIPEEDALQIGAKKTVADLSEYTVNKQKREHPELSIAEYLDAQNVVDGYDYKVKDKLSLIYIQEKMEDNGYTLVVKATQTGKWLFLSSLRRLSKDDIKRDREIQRLLKKEK